MIKGFKSNLLKGLLVLLPIGLTFLIFGKVLNVLDMILGRTIYKIIGMKIPGLGLLAAILLVAATGALASNVIGRKITLLMEESMANFPIVKAIYNPIRDVVKNFTSKSSNNFKKAVFVTYPMEDSYSIGFITKERVQVGDKLKTAIFIPTTPNPTSGFLVYLSSDKYKELDIPVDVALKAIVSLGSISSEVLEIAE